MELKSTQCYIEIFCSKTCYINVWRCSFIAQPCILYGQYWRWIYCNAVVTLGQVDLVGAFWVAAKAFAFSCMWCCISFKRSYQLSVVVSHIAFEVFFAVLQFWSEWLFCPVCLSCCIPLNSTGCTHVSVIILFFFRFWRRFLTGATSTNTLKFTKFSTLSELINSDRYWLNDV